MVGCVDSSAAAVLCAVVDGWQSSAAGGQCNCSRGCWQQLPAAAPMLAPLPATRHCWCDGVRSCALGQLGNWCAHRRCGNCWLLTVCVHLGAAVVLEAWPSIAQQLSSIHHEQHLDTALLARRCARSLITATATAAAVCCCRMFLFRDEDLLGILTE